MTLGTGDMEDNNGKVAVVTGAAGGIAAAIVFGCLFALLSKPKSRS